MKFRILGIEHIGIAQNTNSEQLSNFSDILKLPNEREFVKSKVITEIFDTGAGKIELLFPSEEGSVISKFLKKANLFIILQYQLIILTNLLNISYQMI